MSEEERDVPGEKLNLQGQLIIGDAYDLGDLTVFNPTTKKVVKTFHPFHTSILYRVKCFQQDFVQYVGFSNEDNKIWVWDVLNYKLFPLVGHSRETQGIDHINHIGGKGGLLASCAMDSCVKIWNVENRNCIHTFKEHSNAARQVQFLDERTLFSSCHQDELNKYDLEKQVVVKKLKTDYFWDFIIYRSKWLVGSGYGNDSNIPFSHGTKRASIFDLKTLKVIKTLSHDKPLYTCHVLSNDDILVGTNCFSDNVVYCYDPRTFRVKHEFRINEHLKGATRGGRVEGGVKSLVDIPERNSFATCCQGRIFQMWDYENRKDVLMLETSHGCYGMDYFPMIIKEHQTLLRNKIDASERNDFLITNLSDVVVSGFGEKRLRLWKSLFLRSDFSPVKRTMELGLISEPILLQIMFPEHKTSALPLKSAESVEQYFDFFRRLFFVYGMKRVLEEVEEWRSLTELVKVVSSACKRIPRDLETTRNPLVHSAMKAIKKMEIDPTFKSNDFVTQNIVEFVRTRYSPVSYRNFYEFSCLSHILHWSSSSEEDLEHLYFVQKLNLDRTKYRKFTNLRLRCKGRVFAVHRELLVLRSEFFFRMFRFGGQEVEEMSKKGIVEISLLEQAVLEVYLGYIYYQGIVRNGNCRKKDFLRILVKLVMHSEMFGEWMLQGECVRKFLEIWREISEEECRYWIRDNKKLVKAILTVRGLLTPILLTRIPKFL